MSSEPEVQPAPTSPDRWIFIGLLLVVAWLPWPWGSHSAAAGELLGLLTSLLLGAWLLLWHLRRLHAPALPMRARACIAIWILWLGWIALQLLPLPAALLQKIAPGSAEYWAALATVAPDAALWTASIAPGETVSALLLSLTYFALFLLALLTVSSSRRMRILLLTLVGAGLAQALYGIEMTLSGVEYGFLAAKTANIGFVTGTFVNKNHFAAYMELALSAGIGVMLADLRGWQSRDWRGVLRETVDLMLSTKFRVRVFLVVMVIALVLTRSRMGNAGFFACLGLGGTLYALLRHRRWFLQSLILFLSLLLIDLWIVSDWFGLEKVVERIEQTEIRTEERPLVWRDLVPVVEKHGPTGSGLGSFSVAYAPYRSEQIPLHYDHAHNEYAEFLIEAGWPGCALLAALAVIAMAHALRVMIRRRDRIGAGAAFAVALALAAMAVHASVDFVLQIPAIAATLLVVMGSSLRLSEKAGGAAPAPHPKPAPALD